jgi:hypothetical protein
VRRPVSGFRPEIRQNFRHTQVFSFRIEKTAGFFDALTGLYAWEGRFPVQAASKIGWRGPLRRL